MTKAQIYVAQNLDKIIFIVHKWERRKKIPELTHHIKGTVSESYEPESMNRGEKWLKLTDKYSFNIKPLMFYF
jgi:hypothetical protein